MQKTRVKRCLRDTAEDQMEKYEKLLFLLNKLAEKKVSTHITPVNNACSVAGLLRSALFFLWNFIFLCQGNSKGHR